MSEAASAYPRLSATLTRIFEIDALALRALRDRERPRIAIAMKWLTRAGDTASWIGHAAVLGVVIEVPVEAVYELAGAGLVATVVVAILKRVIRRPRPRRAEPGLGGALADPDAFSFPSGHSAVAFAVAVSAIGAVPELAVAELTLASGIAFSRVYLGSHYPLDVLVGIAIGFASAIATSPFFA